VDHLQHLKEHVSFDLKLTNGDLTLANNSDFAIVQDSDKLIQDILKIVSTPLGGNSLFPWYGSPISQTLIGTAFEHNFISNIASVQLRTSLETLQNLQKEQAKTNQIVTPQEQIAAVQNIKIENNIDDVRFYAVTLTVLSKAFRQTPVSLNIQL